MSGLPLFPEPDPVALAAGDACYRSYQEGWEAGEASTWARAQRTARGMGFRLPDLHELDSPGRGDGAVTPEPSPSLNEREAHAA